jgi:hypothetical protein
MSKEGGAAAAGVTVTPVITTNCALLSYKTGGRMLYAKMDSLKKEHALQW